MGYVRLVIRLINLILNLKKIQQVLKNPSSFVIEGLTIKILRKSEKKRSVMFLVVLDYWLYCFILVVSIIRGIISFNIIIPGLRGVSLKYK